MKNTKNICLPTYKKQQEKNTVRYENTPIAHIFYNILSIDGENTVCKKIGMFYKRMIENFTKWVDIDFEKYAKNEYLSDTNPRKKFRYVPFSLVIDMTAEIKENIFLEVTTKVTLSKKKNFISEKKLFHIWNLKNGTLRVVKK
ncbi:MAG: hypothetical protein E7574_01420 [Ruminococcaceae bacterium]|nr:hypothetical protein [Oscillospiraceae bacterium]